MAEDRDLLLLSDRDLVALLPPEPALAALREAYAALADNRHDQGRALGFAIDRGSIHVKAGLLPGSHLAFAAKLNVNLPENRARNRLPTIQGVVLLADATNGRPLVVMESATLTAIRTAAATALAATYGARKNSRRLAIIGCGDQAHFQLSAVAACFPIDCVSVFDIDAARAADFARTNSAPTFKCEPVASIAAAVRDADICVTCTTATSPVLTDDMELIGCFVAAIGADNSEKWEIAPGLMRRARILVDDLDACAAAGDLAHAIAAGAISRESVHADLADLAAGRKEGRQQADELVVYDSTGSGIQDVAVGWAAYRAAQGAERGIRFKLTEGD